MVFLFFVLRKKLQYYTILYYINKIYNKHLNKNSFYVHHLLKNLPTYCCKSLHQILILTYNHCGFFSIPKQHYILLCNNTCYKNIYTNHSDCSSLNKNDQLQVLIDILLKNDPL